MLQNSRQMKIIMKLLGYPVVHDALHAIKHHDSSFSLNFIRNHEVTKVECSEEYGCCIMFDEKRDKFIRAGSVSSELGNAYDSSNSADRINGHTTESKKSVQKSHL